MTTRQRPAVRFLLIVLNLALSAATPLASQVNFLTPRTPLQQGRPSVHPHRAFKATVSPQVTPLSLSFANPVDYDSGGTNAYAVAIADVNGDGKPDLLVTNCGFYSGGGTSTCSFGGVATGGTVGVLLGNGDGTFQTAVVYSSGGFGAGSIAVADVNGDGKPDLVVANSNCVSSSCSNPVGTVGVLLGNGDGTFQPAVAYSTGEYYAESVAIADVNADGIPDLLVTNCSSSASSCPPSTSESSIAVLIGNGDGTFKAAVNYNSGGQGAYSVAVADVNGDGKPDLLVANYNCYDVGNDGCGFSGGGFGLDGAVGVLLGNGDGTFQSAQTYDSGAVGARSIAVADLNGDGKPDLAVVNDCSNQDMNCILGVVGYCWATGMELSKMWLAMGLGRTGIQSL
jgi:hypothetical protein